MDERINDGLLRQILGEGGGCAPACNLPRTDDKCYHSWGLSGYPLAMVYSPIQEFKDIYELDRALEAGTVFEELDLPFKGVTVTKGGCCHG